MSTPSSAPGDLLLLRHGETEWTVNGRHTGSSSDIPLTEAGEQAARDAGDVVRAHYDVRHVLVSPLARARRTAELAGFGQGEIEDNLVEWDYGGYEGLSTPQIREQTGDERWEIFARGVVPGKTPGETVEDVAARASHVLARCRPLLEDGDVLLVAHGHLLRVLASVWLEQQPRFGANLELEPGGVSVLSSHHDIPTIAVWNRLS